MGLWGTAAAFGFGRGGRRGACGWERTAGGAVSSSGAGHGRIEGCLIVGTDRGFRVRRGARSLTFPGPSWLALGYRRGEKRLLVRIVGERVLVQGSNLRRSSFRDGTDERSDRTGGFTPATLGCGRGLCRARHLGRRLGFRSSLLGGHARSFPGPASYLRVACFSLKVKSKNLTNLADLMTRTH